MSDSEKNTEEKPYHPRPWEQLFLRCVAMVYGFEDAVKLYNETKDEEVKELKATAVYERRNAHEKFHTLTERARQVFVDRVEGRVLQAGETDPNIGLKILERLRSDKWAMPEKRVKLSGDPDAPIHMQNRITVDWAESDVEPESIPEPNEPE